MKTPASLLCLASVLLLSGGAGCHCDDDDCACGRPDGTPPAAPRGLYSITGDSQVTLVWLANTEPDLDGYDVWWSDAYDGEYHLLATVQTVPDQYDVEYVDTGALNGETYFYAVSAFDRAGNASDLSLEEVWDTPRPAGSHVMITDALTVTETAAFDFSTYHVVSANSPAADLHFEYLPDTGEFFLITEGLGGAGTRVLAQDFGWTDDFDEISFAPPDAGWSPTGVLEAIREHTYVFLTFEGQSGYYAKVRLTAVSPSHITFDWAFQEVPWNRQLSLP
jgi:hypothetical protein